MDTPYSDYIEYLIQRNMSIRTINDYRNTFKRFFFRFDVLNERNVLKFLSGHKPSSARTWRVQLKSLADFNDIHIDWKRKVPNPKVHGAAPLTLTPQHERRIYDFMHGADRKSAQMMKFLIETGLRIGELMSLGPQHLVTGAYADGKVYYALLIDKMDMESHSVSSRYVPLNKEALAIIEEFGLPFNIDRRRFNDLLVEARQRLKLPDYKIHTFRKTFLSRGLARGIDVATMANIMGHQDLKTMLVYKDREVETVCQAFLKAA